MAQFGKEPIHPQAAESGFTDLCLLGILTSDLRAEKHLVERSGPGPCSCAVQPSLHTLPGATSRSRKPVPGCCGRRLLLGPRRGSGHKGLNYGHPVAGALQAPRKQGKAKPRGGWSA